MEKPLTPEEKFLISKGIGKPTFEAVRFQHRTDNDIEYTIPELLKEYAQMKVEETENKYIKAPECWECGGGEQKYVKAPS